MPDPAQPRGFSANSAVEISTPIPPIIIGTNLALAKAQAKSSTHFITAIPQPPS
jgi:hypothetical protein